MVQPTKEKFSYKDEITGNLSTLGAWFQKFEPKTGRVVVGGVDLSRPGRPYTFEWGDGQESKGEWPQEHTYNSRDQNYVIRVISNRPHLGRTTVELPVRFAAPQLKKRELPGALRVTILRQKDIKFASHAEGLSPPKQVNVFGDDISSVIPRVDLEYILHAGACIQYDLLNGDVFCPNGQFEQVLFRDADARGMYSLWFTTPVSFGVADYGFKPPIQYSSFFHEMGHNFNLNSPASYTYGGRATGCASDIYTETLAQILQHATCYELINHGDFFGLDDFTRTELQISALHSMRLVKCARGVGVG